MSSPRELTDVERTAAETVRTLQDAHAAGWLIEAVAELSRREANSLAAILTEVGAAVPVKGTKASCRCHFVARDANRRPRVKTLVETLAQQVQNYCIPRSRIEEAREHLQQTGSTERFSALEHEARELFLKADKSGEGGELLLYLLLEAVLALPQLLCKMPLKTSSEMHVHGVDGVHGKLLPNGNLALYWGEAKLHASVNKAIDSCFRSIGPYLLGEAGDRDLLLVRDRLDLADSDAEAALARYFDDSQPESARVEFRGACLLGFDREDYPEPHGPDGVTVREEIAAEIEKWHTRIERQVGENKLEIFELEVFCVPMPSVEAFRKGIRARIATG